MEQSPDCTSNSFSASLQIPSTLHTTKNLLEKQSV